VIKYSLTIGQLVLVMTGQFVVESGPQGSVVELESRGTPGTERRVGWADSLNNGSFVVVHEAPDYNRTGMPVRKKPAKVKLGKVWKKALCLVIFFAFVIVIIVVIVVIITLTKKPDGAPGAPPLTSTSQ
jgi:hypothetical protein